MPVSMAGSGNECRPAREIRCEVSMERPRIVDALELHCASSSHFRQNENTTRVLDRVQQAGFFMLVPVGTCGEICIVGMHINGDMQLPFHLGQYSN